MFSLLATVHKLDFQGRAPGCGVIVLRSRIVGAGARIVTPRVGQLLLLLGRSRQGDATGIDWFPPRLGDLDVVVPVLQFPCGGRGHLDPNTGPRVEVPRAFAPLEVLDQERGLRLVRGAGQLRRLVTVMLRPSTGRDGDGTAVIWNGVGCFVRPSRDVCCDVGCSGAAPRGVDDGLGGGGQYMSAGINTHREAASARRFACSVEEREMPGRKTEVRSSYSGRPGAV